MISRRLLFDAATVISFLSAVCVFVVCPPPNRQPSPPPEAEVHKYDTQHQPDAGRQPNAEIEANKNETVTDQPYKFPYSQYLELVVQILEAQPKFQERIRQLKEDEIKNGVIADHIDDLGHDVFDQLTKAKVNEINRLQLEFKEHLEKGGDSSKFALPEHLDLEDLQKFSKEDLRKLIVKTVADINELDAKRREEFKEYEMKKKAEEDHKLAQLTPYERAKIEKEAAEAKQRHNEHEALKHPGGHQQLEEVWEEKDKMDKDSYDPKTFFRVHDIDGDGVWNHAEVEALFQRELDKMYNESNPDDDIRERVEEMHRMREHVVSQMDKNKDGLISEDEFLQDPEAQIDENKDPGWEDLGQQKIYTDEELRKFEEEYAKRQGWGEHAYDDTQTLSPNPSTDPLAHPQQRQQQPAAVHQNNNQPSPPPPPAAPVPNQPAETHLPNAV